jgi:hypothetical protein
MPSGRLGPKEGRIPCQVCGREYHVLGKHVRVHGLTIKDYRAKFPGARTASENFQGHAMDRLVDAGGLPYWTRPRIEAWIREETKRLGRPPKARARPQQTVADNRFGVVRRSRPSDSVVIPLYGSWNAAIEAAGVDPVPRGVHHLTRCMRGHPFTPENTQINQRGDLPPTRTCRICKARREKKRRERLRKQRPATP